MTKVNTIPVTQNFYKAGPAVKKNVKTNKKIIGRLRARTVGNYQVIKEKVGILFHNTVKVGAVHIAMSVINAPKNLFKKSENEQKEVIQIFEEVENSDNEHSELDTSVNENETHSFMDDPTASNDEEIEHSKQSYSFKYGAKAIANSFLDAYLMIGVVVLNIFSPNCVHPKYDLFGREITPENGSNIE